MVFRTLFATVLVLGVATATLSAQPVQQNNTNAIWFENWIGFSNALLRVAHPDGRFTDVRADQGTPVFSLSGKTVDGVYRYELRATTDEKVKNRDFSSVVPSGEERQEYVFKPFYRTGSFVVERGVIMRPQASKELMKEK